MVVLLLLIDADMKVFAGTRIPAGSLLLVVPCTLVVEAGYHNLQIQCKTNLILNVLNFQQKNVFCISKYMIQVQDPLSLCDQQRENKYTCI